MDLKFDINFQNPTNEVQSLTLFKNLDPSSQSGRLYSFSTPYLASYDQGTIFRIRVNGNDFNITLSSSMTREAVVGLLNTLNIASWSIEGTSFNVFKAFSTINTLQELEITDPNIPWTVSTLTSAATAYAVTFGLNRFVIATAGGGFYSSDDGIGWAWINNTNTWNSITFAPSLGLFVAVGQGPTNRVITSPDGYLTWNARTAPSNTWNSVTWSPELGLLVAVGNGPNSIITSPDGINWTARTAPSANTWNSVCWSPQLGLFVAVAGNLSGAGNRVMTSPDGINWTSRTNPVDINWVSVTWSPELGLFVAISNSNNLSMTSPDGINWTSRPTPIGDWYSICWSPELSLLVAVNNNPLGNSVMTSPDGINWTENTNSPKSSWHGVCWSSSLKLFCAVASQVTNNVMISSTGF